MTARSMLRSAYWIANDAVHTAADVLEAAVNRWAPLPEQYPADGADALAEHEAEQEVWEPRAQCLGCGDVYDGEHECLRAESTPSPEHLTLTAGDPLAAAIRRRHDADPSARVVCYLTDRNFEQRQTFELDQWTWHKDEGSMTTRWVSHEAQLVWLDWATSTFPQYRAGQK